MKNLVWAWCMLLSFPSWAQVTYSFDTTISVLDVDGNSLTQPWSGGLNSIQYNTLDIDDDGILDLVLFDHQANKILTYINRNNQYLYAPEYETLFPESSNWIILLDYNCDGKKDFFTRNPLGLKVFTNTTIPGQSLSWQPYLFFSNAGQPKSEVLLTQGLSGKINLQILYDDLPAIADIDGDGDLDILAMKFGDGTTIAYHQNQSVEKYGTCDSLEFIKITDTWGNTVECQCGVFAFNGEACHSPAGGRIAHSGGKALLAIDFDDDGDQDLVFSEADCNQLFYLENTGNASNAQLTSAEPFPTASTDIYTFPAPSYEDVNFDGLKDLLISPNLFNRESRQENFKQSNWFYQNTATNAQPDFSFVQHDFLQHQMIDVGDHATPTFADFDGDNDEDLFIGQLIGETPNASIALFENTGSSTDPIFQLVTHDYLNISTLELYNIKPQFVDYNRDGKTDLVIGATDIANATSMKVILGNKAVGLDFTGNTFSTVPITLFFSENFLFSDINKDGLIDVLVGRNTGNIHYYMNTGPASNPTFEAKDLNYLSLGPSINYQSAALSIGDVDDDGHDDLVLGTIAGEVSIIYYFRSVSNGQEALQKNKVFHPLYEDYYTPNLGGKVWPVVVNLFHESKPSIVVGNLLGGLQILRPEESTTLPQEPLYQVYPNPISRHEILYLRTDHTVTIEWINTLGQQLASPILLPPNITHELVLSEKEPGVYILKITQKDQTTVKRIVIH